MLFLNSKMWWSSLSVSVHSIHTGMYAILSDIAWSLAMLYICVTEPFKPESCLVYTVVLVDCAETLSKKELPLSGCYVEEYHKSSEVLSLCVDTTY